MRQWNLGVFAAVPQLFANGELIGGEEAIEGWLAQRRGNEGSCGFAPAHSDRCWARIPSQAVPMVTVKTRLTTLAV